MANHFNKEFSISEFAQSIDGACLNNDLVFARIHKGNIHKFNNIAEDMFLTKSRNNIISTLLILSGEIMATVDYIKYNMGQHAMLSISPFKVVTELKASPDFSGYMLICSKNFLDDTILDKKPLSLSQVLSANETPGKIFSPAESDVLKTSLERIEYYLKQESHFLKKDIIHNAFHNFILESINLLLSNQPNNPSGIKRSNKETFIHKFVTLLVEYGDKEHNPAFYADKMCISVQYLSLILKEASGETANTWIAGYLITRSKVMLRNPNITIQQITEILNFSDQSSFGKFFKKHVGIPPKKYKEEYTVY